MPTYTTETKVDEPLKDTEETARLLEAAVINGDTKELTSLIARNANINSTFLSTSLLALAIRHKKLETLRLLLIFGYLIRESDFKEIDRLISDEFQKMSGVDKEGEEGLAILHTLQAQLKPRHFGEMPITFDLYAFLETINSAIVALSPAPNIAISPAPPSTTTTSVTNNTAKPPVLYAFQSIAAADAVTFGINTLFSLIKSQEFNKFKDLLKLLIIPNAAFNSNIAFNIDAVDKGGKTLLHHASINTDDKFLRLLLENKANPNIGDQHGWTPVHLAAFTGKNFNVFMKDRIADSISINWHAKTHKGETILTCALKGKTILEPALLSAIGQKCSNTPASKNPSLH